MRTRWRARLANLTRVAQGRGGGGRKQGAGRGRSEEQEQMTSRQQAAGGGGMRERTRKEERGKRKEERGKRRRTEDGAQEPARRGGTPTRERTTRESPCLTYEGRGGDGEDGGRGGMRSGAASLRPALPVACREDLAPKGSVRDGLSRPAMRDAPPWPRPHRPPLLHARPCE